MNENGRSVTTNVVQFQEGIIDFEDHTRQRAKEWMKAL